MKYEKIDDEDFEKLMKGKMDESVLKEDEPENKPENETEENSGSTGESSEDKTE